MATDVDPEAEPTTISVSEEARLGWREHPVHVRMPVDVRSAALTIIAAAALLLILQMAQPVIIPFVVSGLLFYALDPLVDWLQRWRVPRVLGAATALLLVLGSAGGAVYTLSDDVMAVIEQLPQGARKLRDELRRPSPQPTAIDSMQKAAPSDRGSFHRCSVSTMGSSA